DLVAELVGNDPELALVVREGLGIAADIVVQADLHLARRKDLLEARQDDLAGREAVVGNDCRAVCKGHRDVGLCEGPAVERSEISWQRRRRPLARAEALLAADIER